MRMSDEPKKKRRKKTKAPEPVQEQSSFLPPQDDIKDLISELLAARTKEVKKIRRTEDVNTSLVTTISEFLNCFIIMGYNDEGVPVAITKSNNPQESDALHSLLMKFFSIQMAKFGGGKSYGGDDF